MILQSIALMLFLTNIKYNKYIASIITFIGPLTFGVYLIHDNIIIRAKMMSKILNNYSRNLPYNKVIEIILISALKIFARCAIIDYLRNILFKICQIRRICILIEKLIFLILG
jgi:surface polysaccharide O-acyltransferase-like enzyme